MALMKSSETPNSPPMLEGKGVYLRHPQASDFDAWAEVRGNSRAFLTPWEPVWPVDDLTRPAFRRRIKVYAGDIKEDRAYPFFIFRAEDGAFMGGANISNIRRGVAQACSIGYWIGESFTRQGHTSAAIKALLPFAFKTLKLHRVEAACLPANEASQRLLARVGFQEEGRARKYLKINGEWQDHLLFALVDSDPWR